MLTFPLGPDPRRSLLLIESLTLSDVVFFPLPGVLDDDHKSPKSLIQSTVPIIKNLLSRRPVPILSKNDFQNPSAMKFIYLYAALLQWGTYMGHDRKKVGSVIFLIIRDSLKLPVATAVVVRDIACQAESIYQVAAKTNYERKEVGRF